MKYIESAINIYFIFTNIDVTECPNMT